MKYIPASEMTLVEQVARELCRWDERCIQGSKWEELEYRFRANYRREARKLVKMVCGSCGLAKPLMGKEGA
jgi:hypothetical protein